MKYFKKIDLLILTLILIVGSIITILPKGYAVLENKNSSILVEVLKLENLAKQYIEDTGSSTSATELCFQYLRRNRYNNSKWNTLLGSIDQNFIVYVDNNQVIDIDNETVLIDNLTKKEIDFIHMIAVLNCYYKYGDNVNLMGYYSVSSDYSGWAGDLLTFLEEICDYRIENNITDLATLQEYSNKLLGTNLDSSFSSSDMYADLDAINIYKDSTIDLEDLYTALNKYYVTEESSYNSTNRVASSRNYLGSDEVTIKTKATTLLKNIIVQNFLVSGLTSKVTNEDYNIVSQSFANYILEKSYLNIEQNNETTTIGNSLEVALIESNLGIAKFNLTNDICDLEVINDILYITPLKAGNTEITISSFNESASYKYYLTINNIAPAITKDLDSEYFLTSGIETTINLEADGTNNKYMWYISDSIDGDYSKLTETNIPLYTFIPSMDINNKYIKCIISNDGNNPITSSITKIIVKSTTVSDVVNNIVNTSDMTVKVAIFIIILVLIVNISVFVIRRVKK